MIQLITEKKTNINISSDKDFSEEGKIGKWRDNIRFETLEKPPEQYEYTDTTPLINELNNNEINMREVKEKSLEENIEETRDDIEENFAKPLGIEFTFTKNSENVTSIFLNRDPLKQMYKEGKATTFWTHEIMNNHFLNTFPKEKLRIQRSEVVNPQFMFKTNTFIKGRIERERMKYAFTILKKDDGT